MEGAAVYLDERGPAQLAYELSCDKEWRSRQGHVQGWIGPDSIDFSIVRTTEGAWTVNDQEAKRLENCVDLDFGFTPATNLILLHRLALREGESADAPAAWLNVSTGALELLPQRYERRSEETY